MRDFAIISHYLQITYKKIICIIITQKTVTNYFWRTYDQQELDWLEEENGVLRGFEFKWNENRKAKIPTAFAKAYPDASFEVINKQHYLEFIM